MSDFDLRSILTTSIRRNIVFFRAFAAVALLTALGLGVTLVVTPTRRGEEVAKLAVGGFAGLMALSGVGFALHFERRGQRTLDLALSHPERIQKMEIVCIKRGALRTWALWMTDREGQRLGTMVPSEAAARSMIAQLRAAGASG